MVLLYFHYYPIFNNFDGLMEILIIFKNNDQNLSLNNKKKFNIKCHSLITLSNFIILCRNSAIKYPLVSPLRLSE
jgi:hypothetical protein